MRNEHLRRAAEGVGLQAVGTVISSGNVVFETDDADLPGLESRLETAWFQTLGFNSTTIIRTQAELERMLDAEPFGKLEHGPRTYLLVTFGKARLRPRFKVPYRPRGRGYRLIAARPREIFTVTDNTQVPTPDVMSWIEEEFGKEVTSRTWLTVGRILKRMGN
jgi:uncharacterized protein (DUF1697 family)